MIFYVLDFFFNNLCIYTFATLLFFVSNYNKRDLTFLLIIDIFINGIPVIFISVFILNIFNKWIKAKFVNGFLLDNLLFSFNYILFFLISFMYKNNNFNFIELYNFYMNNFLINYLLFLIIKKLNDIRI